MGIYVDGRPVRMSSRMRALIKRVPTGMAIDLQREAVNGVWEDCTFHTDPMIFNASSDAVQCVRAMASIAELDVEPEADAIQTWRFRDPKDEQRAAVLQQRFREFMPILPHHHPFDIRGLEYVWQVVVRGTASGVWNNYSSLHLPRFTESLLPFGLRPEMAYDELPPGKYPWNNS